MHQRSIGLDILRAIAIVFVFLCHGLFIFYDVLDNRLANLLTAYGHFGVCLFFVLSGFLIGRIFINSYFSNSSFTRQDLLTFWKRRWFRTVPNYYLFFCIYIVIAVLLSYNLLNADAWGGNFQIEKPSRLFPFLYFSQNLFSVNPGFFGQSWSLCVEEWFYLLLPFIIILISKTGKVNLLRLPLKLSFLLLFLLAWKITCFYFLPTFYHEIKVVFSLDYILFGVLVAALYINHEAKVDVVKKKLFYLGLFLFLIVNFLYLKFILVKNSSEIMRVIYPCLSCLAFSLMLPFFVKLKSKNKIFCNIIETISISSYTIYLSHFIFLEFLGNFLLQYFPDPASWLRFIPFIVVFIVCLLFSYFHYLKFEKPVMDLREKTRILPAWLRI